MPLRDFKAVGLDIERIGAVEPPLWLSLFCEAERLALEGGEGGPHCVVATTLFAAKEAFYKAQWPLTHEWVDFLDIEVKLEDERTFTILPRVPRAWVGLFPGHPQGCFAVRDDMVVAAVIIPMP